MKPIHLITAAGVGCTVITCDLVIEKVQPTITMVDLENETTVMLRNVGAEMQFQAWNNNNRLHQSGMNFNVGGEAEYFIEHNNAGTDYWDDALAHRFYLNNELHMQVSRDRVTCADFWRWDGPLIQHGSTNVTLSTGFTLIFPESYSDTKYVATIIGSEPLFGMSVSDKTTNSCTFHYVCVSAQIDWQVVR